MLPRLPDVLARLCAAPIVRVAACFLLMANFASPALAQDSGTVVVDARAEWVDTGIDLRQGDRMRVGAEAAWSNVAEGSLLGPDGYQSPYPGTVLADVPLGALIGRVGDTVFAIGRGFDQASPAEGRLFLAMNDVAGTYGDNRGRAVASISVARGSEAAPSQPDGNVAVAPPQAQPDATRQETTPANDATRARTATPPVQPADADPPVTPDDDSGKPGGVEPERRRPWWHFVAAAVLLATVATTVRQLHRRRWRHRVHATAHVDPDPAPTTRPLSFASPTVRFSVRIEPVSTYAGVIPVRIGEA